MVCGQEESSLNAVGKPPALLQAAGEQGFLVCPVAFQLPECSHTVTPVLSCPHRALQVYHLNCTELLHI